MEGFIGQVLLFPETWIPKDWKVCDGSELKVDEYTALSSVLGYDFREDKVFNLPLVESPAKGLVYIICVNGMFPPKY